MIVILLAFIFGVLLLSLLIAVVAFVGIVTAEIAQVTEQSATARDRAKTDAEFLRHVGIRP